MVIKNEATSGADSSSKNGLPVTFKAVAWHVGQLEPLLQKRTGLAGSHEGPGIAVSECPQDWETIARVGPSFWQLTRKDGADGKFIDYYELTQAQLSEYTTTALQRRLIKQCTRWQVFQGYGEHGESWEHFDSLEEAESDSCANDGNTVEKYTDYEAMPSLDTWWQQYFTRSFDECHSGAGARQIAILKLMMDEGNHDGVWWYEEHDPLGLSAPRGVIFPTRINDWERRCVDDMFDTPMNWSH